MAHMQWLGILHAALAKCTIIVPLVVVYVEDNCLLLPVLIPFVAKTPVSENECVNLASLVLEAHIPCCSAEED